MPHPKEDSRNTPPHSVGGGSSDQDSVGRVHDLAWALLDEQISDAEMAELEMLLRADASARDAYVRCVRMHVDLVFHFQPQACPEFTPRSTTMPVLGMLAEGLPQIGSPPVGDAASQQ